VSVLATDGTANVAASATPTDSRGVTRVTVTDLGGTTAGVHLLGISVTGPDASTQMAFRAVGVPAAVHAPAAVTVAQGRWAPARVTVTDSNGHGVGGAYLTGTAPTGVRI